jgi:hypothetical protein
MTPLPGKETGQTARIERFNNTLRQHCAGSVRKTLSFSRDKEFHEKRIRHFIDDCNLKKSVRGVPLSEAVTWKNQVIGEQKEIILPILPMYDALGNLLIPSGEYTFYSLVVPFGKEISAIDWDKDVYDLRFFKVSIFSDK